MTQEHRAPTDATAADAESSETPSELAGQFMRYVVVGGAAFVLDYGTFYASYKLAGLHYLLAAGLGFGIGLIVNYVLSVRWVFPNRKLEDARAEFVVFALLGGLGLGIHEGVVWVSTEALGIIPEISKLLASAVVLVWNFGSRKLLLF